MRANNVLRLIASAAIIGSCLLSQASVLAGGIEAYYKQGDLTAFRGALLAGADPDLASRGEPLLYRAVRERRYEFIEALLTAGANPNAAPDGREAPIVLSIRSADDKTVVLLLAANANIDHLVHNGRLYLLDVAILDGRLRGETVLQLIRAGAPFHAGASGKPSILCLAAQRWPSTVFKELLERALEESQSLESDPPVASCALRAADDVLERLHIAEMHGVLRKEVGVLEEAASVGSAETVKFLLDHGFNPDSEGERHRVTGYTPLVSALSNKNWEVVRVLLDRGATIDFADKSNKSLQHVVQADGSIPEDIRARLTSAVSR